MLIISAFLALPRRFLYQVASVLVISIAAGSVQGLGVSLLIPTMQWLNQTDSGINSILGNLFDVLHIPASGYGLITTMLLLILVGQVLLFLQRHLIARLREQITFHWRQDYFSMFLNADLAFLNRPNNGDAVNTLVTEMHHAADSMQSVIEILARLFLIGMYIVLFALISWGAALGVLLILTAGWLAARRYTKSTQATAAAWMGAREEYQNMLSEQLGGVRQIKLAGMEAKEKERTNGVAQQLAAFRYQFATRTAAGRLLMEPIVMSSALAVLLLGPRYLGLSLSDLVVFMYLIMRLIPELLVSNHFVHQLTLGLPSLRLLMTLKPDVLSVTTVHNKFSRGERGFAAPESGIVFEGVSFAYGPDRPVMQDLTFSIPAKGLTVITGPSGIGKTTLLDLIAGLHIPTAGRIVIDGTDITTLDISNYRKHVGYSGQDATFFNASIFANLTYGNPTIPKETLEQIARLVGAHSFIDSLPERYSTQLDHKAASFSAGERQRLSIVRALAGNPSIVLLDEVTKNLDEESTNIINRAIVQLAEDRMVIAATHETRLVELACQRVVLDGKNARTEARR